jgi:hypothetical protein
MRSDDEGGGGGGGALAVRGIEMEDHSSFTSALECCPSQLIPGDEGGVGCGDDNGTTVERMRESDEIISFNG